MKQSSLYFIALVTLLLALLTACASTSLSQPAAVEPVQAKVATPPHSDVANRELTGTEIAPKVERADDCRLLPGRD